MTSSLHHDNIMDAPAPDFSNFEEVHERVGLMMHHIARLLPPAPDALDAPTRPIPRHQQPLPALSGHPRHREQWLQDMMLQFSCDPTTTVAATTAATKQLLAAQQQQQQQVRSGQTSKGATPAKNYNFTQSSAAQPSAPPAPPFATTATTGRVESTPYAHLFPDLSGMQDTVSRKSRQQQRLTSAPQQGQPGSSSIPKHHQQNQLRPPSSFARKNNTSYQRNLSPNNNNNRSQQRDRSPSSPTDDSTNRNKRPRSAPANNNEQQQQQDQEEHTPKHRVVPGAVLLAGKKNSKKGPGGVPTSSKQPQSGAAAAAATAASDNKNKTGDAADQQARTVSAKKKSSTNNKKNNTNKNKAARAEQNKIAEEPLPFRDLHDNERLYCYVEFKRRRLRKIPCDSALLGLLGAQLECGTYVIVHGDRDWDMGLVVAKTVERFPKAALRAASRRRRGGSRSPSPNRNSKRPANNKNGDDDQPQPPPQPRKGGSNIRAEGFYSTLPPGRRVYKELMPGVDMTDADLDSIRPETRPIIRLALVEESNLLQNEFPQYEDDARQMCQLYCDNAGLGIEILDCELQFDRKKISFYFDSDQPCDFRDLIKDLYKVFGARIWLENLSDAMRNGALPVPPQKRREQGSGERARSASTGGKRSRSHSPHGAPEAAASAAAAAAPAASHAAAATATAAAPAVAKKA